MDDWSHGYNVSVEYTSNFYREMAPDWLDHCARIGGCVPPRREDLAAFRYLELGSGQGLGLCLLAAANPRAEFTGVDFLPAHVARAERIAAAAGLANIRFVQADFADLARDWPGDFGTFDYVTLHGVYSWVSEALRAALVRCLASATHPGSLVYVSYNTQPGWLSTVPFQHITRLIEKTKGTTGKPVLGESIALFERLRAGEAAIFRTLPSLGTQIDTVKGYNTNYLVQEYLNDSWNPMWHSQVARELAGAGLDHIGSATMAETTLPALLPPPQRDAILAMPAGPLRQDVQDVTIDQSFRRDIFCREPQRSDTPYPGSTAETRLCLLSAPAPGSAVPVGTQFGEIMVQPLAHAELVEALSKGPMTIAELTALPFLRAQGSDNAVQLLLLLIHAGTLAVGAARPATPEISQRLNAIIAREVVNGAPYDHVAASALGGAFAVTQLDLIFFDCWSSSDGDADAATLAGGASDRLATLGRPVQHEGRALEGAEARAHLMARATAFLDHKLPRWRRLGALG